MADLQGGDYIYNVLSNASGVTALTTAIYNSRLIPETETTSTTINFYTTGGLDYSFEFNQVSWSINCRARTEPEALTLAVAVKDAINRVQKVVNSKRNFCTCSILPVIPPIDDTDKYNIPVETLVKTN